MYYVVFTTYIFLNNDYKNILYLALQAFKHTCQVGWDWDLD